MRPSVLQVEYLADFSTCSTDGRVWGSGLVVDALAQTGGPETRDEFPRLHCDGTKRDRLRSHRVGQVVVVAAESPRWDAHRLGEGVQFGKRFVTHEVTPVPTVIGPVRIVDEDGHRATRTLLSSLHVGDGDRDRPTVAEGVRDVIANALAHDGSAQRR